MIHFYHQRLQGRKLVSTCFSQLFAPESGDLLALLLTLVLAWAQLVMHTWHQLLEHLLPCCLHLRV